MGGFGTLSGEFLKVALDQAAILGRDVPLLIVQHAVFESVAGRGPVAGGTAAKLLRGKVLISTRLADALRIGSWRSSGVLVGLSFAGWRRVAAPLPRLVAGTGREACLPGGIVRKLTKFSRGLFRLLSGLLLIPRIRRALGGIAGAGELRRVRARAFAGLGTFSWLRALSAPLSRSLALLAGVRAGFAGLVARLLRLRFVGITVTFLLPLSLSGATSFTLALPTSLPNSLSLAGP